MASRSFSRRSLRRLLGLSPLFLACAACRAPARNSVSDASVADALTHRTSLDDVARGLELADVGPLAVAVPERPSELRPDQAEFWQAAAFAWNPELRRARRAVSESRALARSAGRPGPIGAEFERMDFSDADAGEQLKLLVDALGILGIGPSAAARELAHAETRAALAQLENDVWRTRFDVDRARVRFAQANARVTAFDALYQHALEDAPRLAVLSEHGWVGSAMLQGAYGAVHMAEHRLEMARESLARSRAELARLCGLDPNHPAFDKVQSGAIDRFRSDEIEWRDPSAEELLANLPELRAKKLELAVAEAALQREAREQWPMLRVGPRLTIMPGDTLIGGMLGIDWPFPGALDGRIDAALERREAAREALEDALALAKSRAFETRGVLQSALEQLATHAVDMDSAVARMFDAAQTEFQIDPAALERWSLALRERVGSLTTLIDARGDAVIAWLDYEEARGAREVQR